MLSENDTRFLLLALRRTEDGLRSSIGASIGDVETGTETAERFQARMGLSAERIWKIRIMLEYSSVPEAERDDPIWQLDEEEELEDEEEEENEA